MISAPAGATRTQTFRLGCRVDSPANDARVTLFGVADLPSFLNYLVVKPDIGGRWFKILTGKFSFSPAFTAALNLPSRLRRIIFVGKAPLRLRFRRRLLEAMWLWVRPARAVSSGSAGRE